MADNDSDFTANEGHLLAYLRAAQPRVSPREVARRRDALRLTLAAIREDLPAETPRPVVEGAAVIGGVRVCVPFQSRGRGLEDITAEVDYLPAASGDA